MRHTFSSENVTVHRCFLPIIFSSYLGNRDSMKTGTYEEKSVYYVLPFLLAGTYVKKVLYYVLCKCHNRTYWTFSCPYVPFDFCRRTFLLSFCLYVPYRCPNRIFLTSFRPYVPFVLHKRIFFPFFRPYNTDELVLSSLGKVPNKKIKKRLKNIKLSNTLQMFNFLLTKY